MLLGLLNFAGGWTRIEITGDFPERFLNAAARENLAMWRIEKEAGALRLSVPFRETKKLDGICKRAYSSYRVIGRGGVPMLAKRYRRRYFLWGGSILVAAAFVFMSAYIWSVDVTGNQTVSTAEILEELSRLGVRPWVPASRIEPAEIQTLMLLRMEKLVWLAVNINGNRAAVEVRERTLPPDVWDETIPADIVAAKTGLILRMSVLEGQAKVFVGSSVLKGEVLVSGEMLSAERSRYVRANARVQARVWYALEAVTPIERRSKNLSGRKTTRLTLVLGQRCFPLYFGGVGYEKYEKELKLHRLALGDLVLPVAFVTETYSEYYPSLYNLDTEKTAASLESALERCLRDAIGSGGYIRESSSTYEMSRSVLRVKGEFVTEEEIAMEQRR